MSPAGRLAAAAVAAVAVGAGCAPSAPSPEEDVRFELPADVGSTWYKGNTHTHTTNSDGDSPPDYVARWYKEHGYAFLVLSDHNVFTDPATLGDLVDASFLLIPGEEVTSSFEGAPVHVNALDAPGLIEPRDGETLVATIQANVDAVREAPAVPHVNHPNFRWAFGAEALAQVRGDRLLEVYNGHALVHNEGGGGRPGLEEIWDVLLTGGKRVYGIAVDDAHHFQGEFAPDRQNPGRGWVSVRADALDAGAIVRALEAGHFYASTGVELADVAVTERRLSVTIAQRLDYRYVTRFIGAGGRILAESYDNPAVFELTADVGYVRARVRDSGGSLAWTQPVFVTGG